ncbi:hypothetical protein PMAG_a1040 [Pseudoalteromonas mariniglutinosa NCIMB 1770]|nr:hypothetical protein [Pseudoalteromonas mariniglutinosa NCIMB 1770]
MKLLRSTLINIALAATIFFLVSAFQERNLLKTDSSPAPYFNLPLLSATDTRLSIAELKGKTTVIYFICALVHGVQIQHAKSRSSAT